MWLLYLILIAAGMYVVMCILWAVFCLRVQHILNGKLGWKDVLVVVLNFLFAPISLVFGIVRVSKDLSPKL